jgi:hypothetical protein
MDELGLSDYSDEHTWVEDHLAPNEQFGIDNISVDAQRDLEASDEGRKLVLDISSLRRRFNAEADKKVGVVSALIPNLQKERFDLVRQYLGVTDLPIKSYQGEKAVTEIYPARAKDFRGKYLQVVRGKDGRIIRAEVGFPISHIKKD